MADSTEQGIVAPLMGLPLSGARPAPSSTSVATMVSFHIWAPSQAPSWALKMFPMDCKQGLFDKEYQYINGRKAAASFFLSSSFEFFTRLHENPPGLSIISAST